MIFEYWLSVDDGESSFFPADTPQRKLQTTDVYDRPMTHIYCVRAETWEEAMSAHYALQGWGEYVPMEDR